MQRVVLTLARLILIRETTRPEVLSGGHVVDGVRLKRDARDRERHG
jgi:hypothetical protein